MKETTLVMPPNLLVFEKDKSTFVSDNFVIEMGFDPKNISTEDANQLGQYAFSFFRPLFNGTPFGNEMEGAIMFVMGELERVTPTRFHPLLKYRIDKSPWFHKPHLTWNVIMNQHLIVSFTN